MTMYMYYLPTSFCMVFSYSFITTLNKTMFNIVIQQCHGHSCFLSQTSFTITICSNALHYMFWCVMSIRQTANMLDVSDIHASDSVYHIIKQILLLDAVLSGSTDLEENGTHWPRKSRRVGELRGQWKSGKNYQIVQLLM